MKQRYVIYGNDSDITSSSGYIRSYKITDIDTPEKIKSIIDKFWNSNVMLKNGEYEFVSAEGKDGAIICFARGKNSLKTYGIILPETHPSFNNLITLIQQSKSLKAEVYDAFDTNQRYNNYKLAVKDSIFP